VGGWGRAVKTFWGGGEETTTGAEGYENGKQGKQANLRVRKCHQLKGAHPSPRLFQRALRLETKINAAYIGPNINNGREKVVKRKRARPTR